MGKIKIFIDKLFKKPVMDDTEVEELRIDFQSRYHHFKLLLTSNNRALEVMADIEMALQGKRPFGMSFIRANCTGVSVNVFNMIKYLDQLAPGKYGRLYTSFSNIEKKIDTLLSAKKTLKDERLLISLDEVNKDMADFVGSKMANIGEIKNRLRIAVPDGFVITAAGYDHFIKENDLQVEIDKRFQSADSENIEELYSLSADIQQLIIRSKIPYDLSNAIMQAWRQLEDKAGEPITMALRSSALGEDTQESSFAGQYRSELNVSDDSVFQAYKEVVASKYSLQAITYRLNKGFKDEDISMCVGFMAMVDAAAGGVMYSCNPVNLRDNSIFINSTLGLPKSVVDGSEAGDLFVISRKVPRKIIRQDIHPKEKKFICFPEEGVCQMELTGDAGNEASIDKNQAFYLADLAVKVEDYYHTSQDIEFAISQDGTVNLLQCRPLQQIETVKHDYSDPALKNDEAIIVSGGITASPGSAFGKIYMVDKGIDVLKFPEGAVLVVNQPLPRWASLLNRAAAVVTGQGGFAGHLANVAREFRVPALFGIPDVMDKLTHGEQVTVDADSLSIYEGKIESLLVKTETKINLMEGSPVYKILKRVSHFITPLNLLDPNSLEFNPANCSTFHDITRFIHEKSVHEMFNFGKKNNFSERSSKQLYYKVPMQWWVLNLDDGFKEEVKGKYIKLDNIVSIPMLAFWEGFAAVPWDGPPPIDGKGLMSVMFQSTANPALNPGIRSKYADRNYFMVSKNYCSLNSRLGYHFSILEALVSDRSGENYVSFQFKGGAADYDRRVKRAAFIKDILQKYGFRVDVTEDNLISRIEGHDKDYMTKRIAILGYLTLHTRQLDMIMSNRAKVNYYRSKIIKDIDEVIFDKSSND
ncbi:MAG: PEP/pyruvate-binding domain-containing protein [Thermodesulfobacteriota bacterium]|nr:PEP/pyruvate-binding domain-containing protein [Thermodesulfobacteriota bacterium]